MAGDRGTPGDPSGRVPGEQIAPGARPAPSADPSADAGSAAEKPASRLRFSRRALFGLGGAGLVVGAAAGVGGSAVASVVSERTGAGLHYPFYGTNQAGITTPAQDRLHFAAFDVSDITREELVELLSDWTLAAEKMMAGLEVGATGATGGPVQAPPEDTGEALGLPASGLTLTFGFGRSLFVGREGGKAGGKVGDRFGLAAKLPEALAPLPAFAVDTLDANSSDGDLCIQACADDPQVAVHAIRNLSRIAFGRAAIRWSQLGFGRTSSTSRAQQTPRNLFGFKDGTANIKSEDTADVAKFVWAKGSDGQAWMDGGSYMVTRKIRMIIETWDRQSLLEQERVIGRDKAEGAPMSGGKEFTEPDFAAVGSDGNAKIDVGAHVRLAHPVQNSGQEILRRGYNYVDGNDDLGRLNAGLFFICFQRDPRTGFSLIQQNLRTDNMNEYIRHTSSGLFAVPPGIARGGHIGEQLFA